MNDNKNEHPKFSPSEDKADSGSSFKRTGSKYYLIAGEASGDLHGSNLVREIKKLDAAANIRCWGGDEMQKAGATVVKHFRDLAFMGFWEVAKNLRTILKNLHYCKEDITAFAPDVLVLIDYPGFNLRIAKWAKEQGLKVVYYISPQVWAWKEGRVKLIQQVVDKMLVILPFEQDFYKKWKYDVVFVGHPLIQVIEDFKKQDHPLQVIQSDTESESKPIIALLPGSRKQEISKKLPLMLQASTAFSQYRFVIAQAPGQTASFYEPFLKGYPNTALTAQGQTYALLTEATAALVTSGTATLETALFRVPQVVCYKASPISYQIFKRVIRVPFISLVNLIMNKKVVTELIQQQLTPQTIEEELKDLLFSETRKAQLQKDYEALWNLLYQQENASAKAAQEIINLLQPTSATV